MTPRVGITPDIDPVRLCAIGAKRKEQPGGARSLAGATGR